MHLIIIMDRISLIRVSSNENIPLSKKIGRILLIEHRQSKTVVR